MHKIKDIHPSLILQVRIKDIFFKKIRKIEQLMKSEEIVILVLAKWR